MPGVKPSSTLQGKDGHDAQRSPAPAAPAPGTAPPRRNPALPAAEIARLRQAAGVPADGPTDDDRRRWRQQEAKAGINYMQWLRWAHAAYNRGDRAHPIVVAHREWDRLRQEQQRQQGRGA